MRRRVAWLVAATTSAVVLAFVIPLCLLVRTMAEDRGMAGANQEARNVAILVSSLQDDPRLGPLVTAVDERGPARTSVLTADGTVLGAAAPGLARDPSVRRARAGNAFTRTSRSGAEILVPVVNGAGTDVVRTTVSAQVLHHGVTRAWIGIGLLGTLLLLVAIVIADRLGRRVSTPVTALADVAHRLRGGDLAARAVPDGPPETQELGVALNRLAERITELLAAERAAVADLSHRLRTPVTALRLDAEAVQQGEIAERLQQHIGHLQRTIDAIVKEARQPLRHDMATSCDPGPVVRDRVAFWSALADDQDRAVTVHLSPAVPRVAVDPGDLRDLLDILVDNVFAHTPEGTAFAITLEPVDGAVRLVVEDRGPGIPDRSHAPADRPGFTGLGLQIVRRTVDGFGGRTSIRTAPDRGAVVEVRMPVVPASE
ncbi:HAMP domain-containing histidine kinase [Nocardioides panacis]|uniref:histidine kinase n=1 Tax=Nocardioides panacis TaxID=2849501 RepID=A0A975T030_9ACTN|nr:HAMP domain-containing sensor histidine kinase [Nocardioides panacis]QWZ09031.1 HAMP domain-containing histidine kinase [Nocardioides panacis]